MSDVTAGDKGNTERSAYLFDTRRVTPSGLAGEIVLPPTPDGDPEEQFDRTPYLVGFVAGGERFALLTAHASRAPRRPTWSSSATSTPTGMKTTTCLRCFWKPGCGCRRNCGI